MLIGQSQFAAARRGRDEAASDLGVLTPLARPDFLAISEVRREIQIEREVRWDKAMVGDENVLMQAAADENVDLNFDAFGDDLPAARVVVAWGGGGPSGGRRQKIICDRRMRFDIGARDRLDRLSVGRKGEAGQEPRLVKIIAAARRLDQPLTIQLENVQAAMGGHPFGVHSQAMGGGKVHRAKECCAVFKISAIEKDLLLTMATDRLAAGGEKSFMPTLQSGNVPRPQT